MKPSVVLALGIVILSPGPAHARAVHHRALDHVEIFQDRISKEAPIRLRAFSTEGVDLGTGAGDDKPKYEQIAKHMQELAPRLTLRRAVSELQRLGFTDVAELAPDVAAPATALVVEGRFTKLNPGTQWKRELISFGAGKSQVCAEGRVVDAQGRELMHFAHCRNEAWGEYGGESGAMMAKDCTASAPFSRMRRQRERPMPARTSAADTSRPWKSSQDRTVRTRKDAVGKPNT